MSLADAKANALHVWLMNGADSANEPDAVGSNTATQVGDVSSTTGKFSGARRFTGPHRFEASGVSGTGSFSLFAWVYRDATTNAVALGGQNTASGDYAAFYFGVGSDNKPYLLMRNNSSGTATAAATSTLANDEWHLLVATYDSSSGDLTLYVDGASAATANLSGTRDVIAGLRIGASWWAGGVDAPWRGYIDECGILGSYVMSSSDVSDLWNSGTGVSFDDWDAGESSITGSGGVVVAGSGTVTVASAITASGGAVVGGAGSPVLAVAPAASGGAVLGGSGTATTSAGATASGGVVIEGAGTAALAASVTASGGVVLEGAGAASAAYAVTSSGAVVLAGAASVSAASALTASGGVVIEGAGGVVAAFTITSSGGVVIAGAGSLGNEEYSDTGSGGAAVGGSGTASLAAALTTSGGVSLEGAGTATLGAAVMGSGGVVIAGAGGVSAAYRLTGAGGPAILGAGVDSSGDTVYSMAVLVQAALPSQPVIRGARTTTSPVIRAVSWGPVIVRAALPT